MKKKNIAAVLLLTIALLLSGCGQSAGDADMDVDAKPGVEDTEPEPEPEPIYLNPLTGLQTEKDISMLRPYAVMLNNKKEALPQLGVSQADIIYEICAEGGITRMEGIFQTVEGVGNLGSIRSIRPYYIEIATGYDAIVIHAGGSEEAYSDLKNWGINHFDGVRGGKDASIFWRDEYRKKNAGYEHSMLTSGEKILEYVNTTTIRQEHKEDYKAPFSFSETNAASGGAIALDVTVKFSNYKTDQFTYDPKTGLYMIKGYGKEYVDGNTNQQVGVTNLLVLNTNSKVLDSEGRLKVDTTGSGSGTYFCGGSSIDITWERNTRNDNFVYKKTDGSVLEFMAGKTYICVINPKISSMTVAEPQQ